MTKPALTTVILGLVAAALGAPAGAYEVNAWPAYVLQKDPAGKTLSWTGAGPFLFSQPAPAPDAGTSEGFRPLYVRITGGGSVRTDILYPLFFYRKYPDSYKWSIFNLVNGEGIDKAATRAGGPLDRHFDVWPFYFSHETGEADSYRALFPIYGTIKNRLFYTDLHWVLFPIYVESERSGTHVTYVPWPIVRSIRGAQHGFAVWPLFGVTHGPGSARHSYYLWPLIWDNVLEVAPDTPPGTVPGRQIGFLPFFTRDTAPGLVDENFVWPFFGFTERTSPDRYSERRYFWPFFVQGRGDKHYLNRWGPFYTHSEGKSLASTWVLWPLWHNTRWADDDTSESQTQFFYFLYWSLYETSISRPGLPPAYKRHIWPVYSAWDNGAGNREVQVLSPFEVFFPDNPDVRAAWTPLLAIYRYQHLPTGESRTSLLWNAVTVRRGATGGVEELHIGPLGMRQSGGETRWSVLGFDFHRNRGKVWEAKR